MQFRCGFFYSCRTRGAKNFNVILGLSEFGNAEVYTGTEFVNCFAYGAYNNDFAEQFSSDTIFERNIMIVPFTDLLPDRCCTFENC